MRPINMFAIMMGVVLIVLSTLPILLCESRLNRFFEKMEIHQRMFRRLGIRCLIIGVDIKLNPQRKIYL